MAPILLSSTLAFVGCDANDLIGVAAEADPAGTIETVAAQFVDAREEFLSNGGVESGTVSPDGWWSGGLGARNYTFEWSTEVAASGARSVKVSRHAVASNEFGFWAQTVDVGSLAGTRLTLRASVKLDDVVGNVSIAIRGDDTSSPAGAAETFSSTERRISVNGTRDWTELEVSLDEFPSDIKSVTVYLILVSGSTGTAYFDDVSLSSGSATPNYHLQDTGAEEVFKGEWWYGGLEAQHYTFERSSDHAVSPTHSLKISKDVSADSTFGYWAQTIRADSLVGRAVTLTGWVKTERMKGEGMALAIRGDDSALPSGFAEVFATTQGQQDIITNAGWALFSVTLPDVPPEIQSLTVYLIHLPNTTGTAYLDDIILQPTS